MTATTRAHREEQRTDQPATTPTLRPRPRTALRFGWTRPTRPWIVLGLVVVGAISGIAALTASLTWLAPTWNDTIVALREGVSPWVMAAAVLAAAGAGPVSRHSVMVAPWTARAGWPATVRQVGVMVTALWTGLALTGGAGVVVTAVRTNAGGLNLVALATTLPVTALWVVLGYAVGVLVPRGWSLLVALLVAGVVWFIPAMVGPHLQAVAPVWAFDWPQLGDTFAPAATWLRLAFFVGLCGCLLAFTARIGRRFRGPGSLSYSTVSVACLVPALALGSGAVARHPAMVQRDSAPLEVCANIAGHPGSSVCLHEGHRQLLEPLATRLATMLDVTNPATPLHVIERAVATQEQFDAPTVGADATTVVLYIDGQIDGHSASRTDLLGSALSLAAAALTGAPQCSSLSAASGSGVIPESLMHGDFAANDLARVVVARAGSVYQPPYAGANPAAPTLRDGLAAMTDAQLTAWIAAHHEQITTCSLDDRKAP